MIINWIKNNWKSIIKFCWWLLLVSLSSVYSYFYVLNADDNISIVDTIIFAILAVLVLLPLISEVSILGVSLKKIEETKKELNDKIVDVKYEALKIAFNNSSSAYVELNMSDFIIPSPQKISEDINEHDVGKINDRNNRELVDRTTIDEDHVYLFKNRYILDGLLTDITSRFGYKETLGIRKKAEILYEYELIDKDTFDIIVTINSICNRGVHGLKVEDKYIDYVELLMPSIVSKLDEF